MDGEARGWSGLAALLRSRDSAPISTLVGIFRMAPVCCYTCTMRTPVLLLLSALACSDSEAPTGNEAPSAPIAAPAPKVKAKAKTEEVKRAPTTLDCDQWLTADLLKAHCGVDAPFVDDGNSAQTAITCSRNAKSESGATLSVALEKLVGNAMGPTVRRRYPDPPALEKKPSGARIKGRNFPYLLTVRAGSRAGKPVCTDEQAMALTNAILAKLPGSGEPASKANSACDTLLTSADIKSVCSHEGTVTASLMEDGNSLYCNRAGSGLVFLVSKHATEEKAKRGADVAREDTSAGVAHKGAYSIEVKTSVGSTTCDKAGLETLAKLVADRL